MQQSMIEFLLIMKKCPIHLIVCHYHSLDALFD